jgi:glucose-6-phosphate isomerase
MSDDVPVADRHLDPLAGPMEDLREELERRDAIARLWKRDHTLWQEEPAEVADRLGWLDVPTQARDEVPVLEGLAATCAEDGMTDALVLGMGGSSLFPLVLADTFEAERLRLHVLDSVDPAAVRRVTAELPLARTLMVASSKSGTTVETRTLLTHFAEQVGAPDHVAVVTDPGSALATVARERGFRATIEAPPEVGGRFSALTPFGLAPGALLGAPLERLLGTAERMAAACQREVRDNPAAALATALVAGVRTGCDKLTLVLPERIAAFAAWVEQLVAESTGKAGTGILPVVGEEVGPPEVYGDDRLFVTYGEPDGLQQLAGAGHPVVWLDVRREEDLGGEVVRWEVATALAGALLGVNPFDQPDVEAAKVAAREALDASVAVPDPEPLDPLLDRIGAGDHLALLVYVDPASPVVDELEEVRTALRDQLRVAVTVGIGPRYLHSTGQLHKGGPDSGVFAVAIGPDADDVPIPGQAHTFGQLKRAQAVGDLSALRDRGRRAALVDLDELLAVT